MTNYFNWNKFIRKSWVFLIIIVLLAVLQCANTTSVLCKSGTFSRFLLTVILFLVPAHVFIVLGVQILI